MGGSVGDFFAVDRLVWAKACKLGLNPAVAYLVLARFSGRDNATTAASVNAIEKYTGIGRSRAKKAVAELCASTIVRLTKTGSHPRYELSQSSKDTEESNWIWLPNALVSGVANETPPVERVRQAQDVLGLRLLIDLYHAQNLVEDGGISRDILWQTFDRREIEQRGAYTVWAFFPGKQYVDPKSNIVSVHFPQATQPLVDAFFQRLDCLCDTGLIQWIPYVVESETNTAEPLFACGGDPETLDRKIGNRAFYAAKAILSAKGRKWVTQHEGQVYLVPLPRHLSAVSMEGVARLRYRPKTKMTAAWWGAHNSAGERWLKMFQEIENGNTVGCLPCSGV